MLIIVSPNGRCYLVDMLSSTIRWYVETEKGALYLVNRGNKVVDYLDLKPQDPDKIDWSENNMNCYHFKPDTEPQGLVSSLLQSKEPGKMRDGQLRDLHNLAHIILHIISNGQHDVKDVDVVPETFNDRILDRKYISSLQLQGTNEEALDLFEKLGILIGSQKRGKTHSATSKRFTESPLGGCSVWFLVPGLGYTVPVPTTGPPMYNDGDLISLIRFARNAVNHTERNKTEKNSQKRKVLLQELGKDENELERNLRTKFPLLLTKVHNVVANYRIDKMKKYYPQDSPQISEPTSTVDKTKQRSWPVRKSDMPPVKDEELVPGASFTGKVRSIQPFGAFIDFGAFTDGLVHVSRLSDGYVKDVANVVSVGQEVKVKLVEANIETGQIAVTMRENESASGGDSSRPPRKTGQGSGPRRNEGRKTTKFVKGQDLDGTVKNLTRSGAFINLPEGEEGFLPQSEEADEGFGSLMGDGSSLEVGQEVKVKVLKIARATNPFLVAFRQNKDIASFLDEREKVEESTVDEKVEAEVETSAEAETQASVEETEVASPEPEEVEKVEPVCNEEVKPEETSSITGSSEQVDAPVVEENVVEGLNSCSSVTKGGKIVASEEQVEVPEATSEEQVEVPAATSEEQVEVPEETSSAVSSSEQVDVPVTEKEDVKIEPVSDENGSITSEEQVDVHEEPSSVTNSVEQVVEENAVQETQVEEAVENKFEETEPKEVDAVTPVEDQKVEVEAVTPVAETSATKGL
ncbi:nucleic acid-binding, OB-fold protein [Tanacetum coccineum]